MSSKKIAQSQPKGSSGTSKLDKERPGAGTQLSWTREQMTARRHKSNTMTPKSGGGRASAGSRTLAGARGKERPQVQRRALLDLARAAMRNVTLAKAAQEFLGIIIRSVQAQAGTVYVYDEARNELLLAAHKGLGRKLVAKTKIHKVEDGSESVAAKTAFQRGAVYVHDIATEPVTSYVRTEMMEGGFVSMVSLPLLLDNDLVGVVQVVATKDRHFETEDLSAVRSLSEQMAATLLRLKTDAEVRAREQYLANIMEDSADGIVGLSTEEEIVSWNRGAENIFGYTAEEVVGKHFSFLVPDNLVEVGEIEKLRKAIRIHGYIQSYETERLTKDGRRIAVSLTRTVIRDADGKVLGSSAIVRDTTEQKKLEEKLLHAERLAAIGRMSAKVAHEIRNPLSSISLNTELLEEEVASYERVDGREAMSLLKSIATELDRLTEITEDYLRFAKLPAPRFKAVTVNSLVKDLLGMLENEIAERRVKVHRKLAQRLPRIKVDQEQLRRALLNMLKNSLEAMPNGGDITVSTGLDSGRVSISIADTGTGIREEDLDHIFNPFFTTKEIGTGLGLPLAQQIVAEHGGEIGCSSEWGRGATFVVTLPNAVREK
jgi:PAS domain S-box-containing protein